MEPPPVLASGPMPLTRAQGYLAAVTVAVVAGLLLGVIPGLARAGSAVVVPPDAVRFGSANLVPPLGPGGRDSGWRIATTGEDSLTMSRGGVRVLARTVTTMASPAEQFDDLRERYSDRWEAGSGEAARFLGPVTLATRPPSGDGLIGWAYGAHTSAVLAVIPLMPGLDQPTGTTYAEVVVYGPTQAMDRYQHDTDAIIRSIRFSLLDLGSSHG